MKNQFELLGYDYEPIHRSSATGMGHHNDSGIRKWNAREFIAWDGEGTTYDTTEDVGHGLYRPNPNERFRFMPPRIRQPYVLLANSKGERITRKESLEAIECFEFFLDAKQRYPKSIFVGFGFSYDVNQMLEELPAKKQRRLLTTNRCHYLGYSIGYRPRKSFQIHHHASGRKMILYDVIGFFQSTFVEACIKYLGEDDPRLAQVMAGKDLRSVFDWKDLHSLIIPYCDLELSMTVDIMTTLRADLHATLGFVPPQWHGPGAIASKLYSQVKLPICRDTPEEVLNASQYAYAGGRFEQFWLGHYPGTVYEYDINSAYPAATLELPDLTQGHWDHVTSYEPGTFGVWFINYESNEESDRPQPLFCRSANGSICYPRKVRGWYWTPEAELVPDSVQEGWVFRPSTDARPFAFVEERYDQRRLLQTEENPAERALKLTLNSLYGKLAQTIGGAKDHIPRWHQLEWAGYITSYTRAMIYRAIQLAPDCILAAETDAVFSMVELDLPIGDSLGEWKLKTWDSITYIQSGFYYRTKDGVTDAKYRGMDKDKHTGQPVNLNHDTVLAHFDKWNGIPMKSLYSTTNRFINMAFALLTTAIHCTWETKAHMIRLNHIRRKDRVSKRLHIFDECDSCQRGISMATQPHPLIIGGFSGDSYARKIPWRDMPGVEIEVFEWCEENAEWKYFETMTEAERW